MNTEASTRGRPAASNALVAASIDGQGIAWVDGIFAGSDPNLVREARLNARLHVQTTIHPLDRTPVLCDDETPLGAAASMLSLSPRAILVSAPAEVWDTFPGADDLDINTFPFEPEED